MGTVFSTQEDIRVRGPNSDPASGPHSLQTPAQSPQWATCAPPPDFCSDASSEEDNGVSGSLHGRSRGGLTSVSWALWMTRSASYYLRYQG